MREDLAIVDTRVSIFFTVLRSLFFHCMSASRHSDSTADIIRCVFLCVHGYRAFRKEVQAVLQIAAAADNSHALVSGGNGGRYMFDSWKDRRAAILVLFAR